MADSAMDLAISACEKASARTHAIDLLSAVRGSVIARDDLPGVLMHGGTSVESPMQDQRLAVEKPVRKRGYAAS